MKAPLQTRFEIVPNNLLGSVKQELLDDSELRYFWVALSQPIRQDGHDFSYLVAPFKFTTEMKLEQNGAGVLCQTEAETKESFENLVARSKKHLVSFQAAGIGGVAWAKNLRRIINEIGVSYKTLPDGKAAWLAFEREMDKDTLEVTVVRRKKLDTKEEADFWARRWLSEYNQKKEAYFDGISKSVTTPPPPGCSALTTSDIEDLGKAKILALQRQWPRCFGVFEKQKDDPNSKISDKEIEDAYLADLVGHGGDLWACTGGRIRADLRLITVLHKAAERYAKRGKRKIIDAAIYLIAFNWELSWCYLSNEKLAEKLSEILETPFTPEQVEKYRYRFLGLVSKHSPGPPPKSP